MYKKFGFLLTSLLFMELVYHFTAFGLSGFNPLLMIPALLLTAAVETALMGITQKRIVNKTIMWIIMAVNYLIYASQVVYYKIFQKPLMIDAAVNTGAAALTDFWRVALEGIGKSIPALLLLALPLVGTGILSSKRFIRLRKNRTKEWILLGGFSALGILLTALVLVFGYVKETEYYEAYQEMYDPEVVIREYGVMPLFGRQMLGDVLPQKELSIGTVAPPQSLPESSELEIGTEAEMGEETEGPGYDTSPNVLNIDFDALLEKGNDDVDKLVEIMQSLVPTNKNEYTGMFEGYNLVYITAEAFAPYALTEELTPTLYNMMHSGIVVEDYYVPLWATSTSDGEYVNLTGQIPDGQFSFKRTSQNEQPYSLPAYFAKEGVKSFAYHNNSLSYYDRHLSHPNLGYDFKAAKLGSCSSEEWGDKIFPMENPKYWPSSDYEMMVSTIPEWINEERFHAYYMSVSGHAGYSFEGNMMAYKNKDVVADMTCSTDMKAYIACNYELEKAVAYLVEELEKAGKLDNTMIVISADHYPYSMEEEKIEEYLGEKLDNLEIQKNGLIMWNSAMETITIDKTCSAMDIMPTILNLFGFEYDSRLFPGNDILSEAGSLVVFSDRSFITDTVIYNAADKSVESRTGEEVSDEYIKNMKAYVKLLFKYSAGILNDDYFKYVNESVIE